MSVIMPPITIPVIAPGVGCVMVCVAVLLMLVMLLLLLLPVNPLRTVGRDHTRGRVARLYEQHGRRS